MVQNLKTKKIKYAIQYLRVSTLVQGKEDKTGIARQEDGFQRWLGQHPDYTPWDEKFEDIGKSAFKSYKTRGALLAILDLAEKGSFGEDACLVIDSVSRLSREPQLEALDLLLTVFKKGLTLAVIELGGEIYEKRNENMYWGLLGAFSSAHSASRLKSHLKRGSDDQKIERFKKGDTTTYFKTRTPDRQKVFYPCWLQFHEGLPKDAPLEKKWSFTKHAEWVKQIFEWALTMGSTEISKRLYEQGWRSLTNPKKPMSKHFIDDTLTNPAVIGHWQPMKTEQSKNGGIIVKKRGNPIEGLLLPVISPEAFQEVQEVRKKRSRNKDSRPVPRPTEKIRNLFNNAIFCSQCNERVVFRAVPKATLDDKNNMYHYYECSAGYNRAVEICTCAKRFNAKKKGTDFELDVLKRLISFRWIDYFSGLKHENELKEATIKKMLFLNRREEASREKNRLTEKLDILLEAEDMDIDVIKRMNKKVKRANEKYDDLNEEYNSAMMEEVKLKNQRRGTEAEREIQSRIKSFIENGRTEIKQRQEFSTWFHSMDLKILLNIEKSIVEKRCCFEIGIGKVGTQKDEKNKLTELDQTLEDADSFGLDLEKVQKEIEATTST